MGGIDSEDLGAARPRIGVIGGSGLYQMDGAEVIEEITVPTPFGATSDVILHARLGDADVYFLPRHGRRHHLLPSEVPYRANIWALKSLGVGWVISVSAVGSLREHVIPGEGVVLVDQFIDRTIGRDRTFFGQGVVAHVGFADPVCGTLRQYLVDAAVAVGTTVHDGGTYVCIEGPAFSTRAESHWFRAMGATVVGMTNLPEARLAREAEISYATIALPTDFDCWHEGHDAVSVDQVMATLRANVGLAHQVLAAAIPRIVVHAGPPPMHDALESALMTRGGAIPPAQAEALRPLLARFLA